MPKAKRVKSTSASPNEPNTEPNRRTKKNKDTKLDTELNTAMSLVTHKDAIDPSSIPHAGTRALMAYNAKRKEIDLTEVRKTSIDKHVENTRFKVAYVVDQLADELIREASKKTKKDKEHLKGITWAFGTLYDKLANVSTDAQVVSLPSKLLANVTEMIKAQTDMIRAAQSVAKRDERTVINIPAQTELIKASADKASAEGKASNKNSDSSQENVRNTTLSSSSKGQAPIDVTPTQDSVSSLPDVAQRTAQDTTKDYVA